MTGVYNRQCALYTLSREIPFAKSKRLPLVLCMVDIDGLIKLNDIFGHHTGDMIIKKFSNDLKFIIGCSDSIFRWEGDVFMIILRNTMPHKVHQLMQRLREHMSQKNNFRINIDFSYGFSVYAQDRKIEVAELIQMAEKRMFIHKTSKLYWGQKMGRIKNVSM